MTKTTMQALKRTQTCPAVSTLASLDSIPELDWLLTSAAADALDGVPVVVVDTRTQAVAS